MPTIGIGRALRIYRDQFNITLSELATMLDVSTTTIVNYETGRRLPDVDFLITFAEATGEDFLYWLGLRIAKSKSPGAASIRTLLAKINVERSSPVDPASRYFVSLPLYDIKDTETAGSASGYERVADEMLQFSTTWIEQELNATPSDLFLIHVDDEGMVPTMRPGDTILLDRRATRPDREGIYILRVNGVPMVKRLQILPGKLVKVVSDNPAYETFTICLSDINGRDFAILGRVVWVVWPGRRI